MKKLLATILCLTIIGIAVVPAAAQTCDRRPRTTITERDYNRYDARDDRRAGRNDRYDSEHYDDEYYDDRSIWDKHRDKITTAGGAAGGAALGGLIGGKKGAIIGAITGGAGAAIYTYKIRKKDRWH